MRVVHSILSNGFSGRLITVECTLSNSLPSIVIVGFAHRSIDEAKERIRGAMASSGLALPRKRIILNLAPADIPKEGSSFDLAMLVALLATSQMIRLPPGADTVVMGEVGLNGSIRPIRGIIGKVLAAKSQGITKFWIPQGNLSQASLVPDVTLHAFTDIRQLARALNCHTLPPPDFSGQPYPADEHPLSADTANKVLPLIIGQTYAKRAVVIAAAGHHHLLLNGPPGTGKTMLAKTLPALLPDLSHQELLEVTQLHSLASKNFDHIITSRPFRTPHHSASHISILGGGAQPRPGEISLSHYGVLLLDELPEFNRSILEALRQPLEEKTISIARSKDSVTYPADFLLAATANPCPCGFYGSAKPCLCAPAQVMRYQKKISGPILDRIDLYVDVEAVPPRHLLMSHNKQETRLLQSAEQQRRLINEARQLQLRRSGKLNSRLTNDDLQRTAALAPATKRLLDHAADQLHLSARGYMRSLRVARTIADLEHSRTVESTHISEALQYRKRAFV